MNKRFYDSGFNENLLKYNGFFIKIQREDLFKFLILKHTNPYVYICKFLKNTIRIY